MDEFERLLIHGLISGSQKSFTMLFEHYSSRIYSLAFRICGSRDDAEDIVQETFIKAWENIHAFRGECSLCTWLYTITKNLCYRVLENKKRGSFSRLKTLSQAAQEPLDAYTLAEKQFYIIQVKDGCLLGLLRCLPFYQRMAFVLNVLLEVTIRDVSKILQKSAVATRLLVHRARKKLHDYLCRNCSLYKHDNSCHCESLINFSLKNGWIQKAPDDVPAQIAPMCIEQEIDGLKRIVLLYQSITDHPDTETMVQTLQAEINKRKDRPFFK